jgi:competence protein ComEA
MKDWLEIHKTILFAVMAVLILMIVYLLIRHDKQQDTITFEQTNAPYINEPSQNSEIATEEKSIIIMVDVKGAVKLPGVYVAEEGERTIDLIKKAGGFTNKADQNQVNLSQHVEDEMVIHVPNLGEINEKPQIGFEQSHRNFININKASESELQTLPGIGPSKALAIIEYRETNGGFQTVEDLKKISGIGEKTFEKLKPHISTR